MIKAIILFLLIMVIIAMIGGAVARASGRRPKPLGVAKIAACPKCGKRDIGGAVLGRPSCGCGGK